MRYASNHITISMTKKLHQRGKNFYRIIAGALGVCIAMLTGAAVSKSTQYSVYELATLDVSDLLVRTTHADDRTYRPRRESRDSDPPEPITTTCCSSPPGTGNSTPSQSP